MVTSYIHWGLTLQLRYMPWTGIKPGTHTTSSARTRDSFKNPKITHPIAPTLPPNAHNAPQPFSLQVVRGAAMGFQRRQPERWPYLQQHHIHSPVHLGDVTQAVAALVPLIHSDHVQERGTMRMCPGEGGDQRAWPVQSPQFLPVSCRGRGLPGGALCKTLQGPKMNQKEPSGIHFPELTRNFLTTPERWNNEFIIHNINNACLLVLYFMQILAEREAHAVSITGGNSRRKIKNELAEHNGRRTWGEKAKQAIQIQ